jgi:hypothetical protein
VAASLQPVFLPAAHPLPLVLPLRSCVRVCCWVVVVVVRGWGGVVVVMVVVVGEGTPCF